jgi:putative ABC transport system permease protein
MLKHNLLIIFRNFRQNKSTFFINLIGLSTGLVCALFIYLWVSDELNVDRFNENDNQLYQVMQNYELANGIVTWEYTPVLLANELVQEMPEVEAAVSLNSRYVTPHGMLSYEDKHFKTSGKYASKDLFRVFSYQLLQGDHERIFTDNNSILISQNFAKKLFHPTEDIIGKTLIGNQDLYGETFTISGVFENPPSNATDQFDFILNFDLLRAKQSWVDRWQSDAAETYLILKKGTNIAQLNEKIAGYLRPKTPTREPSTLFLQQFSKRYLYGNNENGVQAGGRISYVKIFSAIAIFILMIACINFMNLSTAKASTRVMEIGVKKAIGANRKNLIVQYLGEAMLMAFLSLGVSILMIELLLPQYNHITGKELDLTFNPGFLMAVIGITTFTGIISGSYPAFYLSGFNPVNILKGRFRAAESELWIRKGLVIFQFTLSVIFIVSFFAINKQIEFVQNKNLGYNRNNVLCFQWEPTTNNDLTGFISGLKNVTGVENVSHMAGSIIDDIYIESGYSWRGLDSDKDYAFKNLQVGENFMETLDIEVIQGRSFSSQFNDDYSKVIFNEAAMQMMNLENPVGKILNYGNEGDTRQIVGVVKNFHYGSLHNYVEPLVFNYKPWGRKILIKINSGAERATINRLKAYYEEFHSGFPFEFTFLDDEYQALYDSENKVAILSKYFTGLAIITSCLGLFGLAAFTAQRRRKEIGIRKVLGSSELGIITLLSGDFTKLVLISILIALPASYLITKAWLHGYAYRIDLKIWFFAGAALITLIIAWLTVVAQAIRAATTNPVESLKYE